jgi:hypothetical protein
MYQVCTGMYLVCTNAQSWQVLLCSAYLDSLSMDGAEVAVNCLCSARSCATCWCPDSELADGHCGEMNHPLHCVSTWLLPRTWWAESP